MPTTRMSFDCHCCHCRSAVQINLDGAATVLCACRLVASRASVVLRTLPQLLSPFLFVSLFLVRGKDSLKDFLCVCVYILPIVVGLLGF
jgi:hypothetical protein